MFLLGRQAMLGQDPPTYFRSITAVFIPCLASAHDVSLPAAPLPRMRRSYSSICEDVFILKGLVHPAEIGGLSSPSAGIDFKNGVDDHWSANGQAVNAIDEPHVSGFAAKDCSEEL